jgi:cell division protein FtsW (lipid II flippase)
MLGLLSRTLTANRQWTDKAIVTMAGALLATTLLGDKFDGAARWTHIGGLPVQPSLILLPVMLVAFSRTRGALATIGVIATVVAIALQPDRAMAGTLALALAALAIMRPDRHVVTTSIASLAGLAVTLARSDTQSTAPYVDQILYSSFDVHFAAGMAVLGGSALLLVPAIVGWVRDPAHHATYAIFGAVWFAVVLAAALGNYPTPIVGYGGSAIIGYALSLFALPKLERDYAGAMSPAPRAADKASITRPLLVRVA